MIPRRWFLGSIKERRRDQHARDSKANRLLVWEFLSAQLLVERSQLILFGISERTPIRAFGEFQHAVEMRRLRIDQQFSKFRRAPFDRLAKRFKCGGVGVLGGILPKLIERIDKLEGILADVM